MDVVKDYFSDPLVFRSLSFRFGYLITEAQKYVNENISKLELPTIVLHGKQDKIVPISGCSEISKLKNVTFKEVENSKHEILNQDTRPFVLSEIFSWLQKNKLV
jgi:alpha-beta hydrolase superfamily lysophospholipase